MNRIGDNLLHFPANEEVVRSFVKNEVEFILIGGLAISWHRRKRQADDMDLLVNPTKENSERVAKAFEDLGLKGASPNSFTAPGVQAPLKQRHYAEVLTPRKGGVTFSEVAADSVDGKLFQVPIKIASVSTLIKLKQEAVASAAEQLQKHQADVELLRNNDV
jgi:hypothetical protein